MNHLSIALVFLTISCGFAADVPYVFTPGTPAKSSEVNANFANLSTRVSALESSTGGGSGGGGSSGAFMSYSSSAFTYSKIAAAVGSTVSVNGVSYVIAGLPVLDPVSGLKYRVTMPLGTYTTDGAGKYSWMTTVVGVRGSKPAMLSIDGHDAEYGSTAATYVRATNATAGATAAILTTTFTIAISNNCFVTISFNDGHNNDFLYGSGTITGSSYDYSSPVTNYTQLQSDRTAITGRMQEIQQLINYITITQVP